MGINSLSLNNFRNFSRLELTFPQTNLILIQGQNAQGKTNLLESIYLLACAKSFRTSHIANLIQWNCQESRIIGLFKFSTGNLERELTLSFNHSLHKQLLQNNKPLAVADFVQQIPIVLFSPEDLYHINSHPSYRRRYLDRILTQTDPQYLFHRSRLTRILKQRNSLIRTIVYQRQHRNINTDREIAVWDTEFAHHSSYISQKRHQLITALNRNLSHWYESIAQEKHIPMLSYTQSSSALIEEAWKKRLAENYEKDLHYQTTTQGPHRDDLNFQLNNQPLQVHASRGEIRSFFLSLKLAEIAYIEETTAKKPILLLDDVFSELDHSRQAQLLSLIKGYQTFVTTTHLPDKITHNFALFQVSQNQISFVS